MTMSREVLGAAVLCLFGSPARGYSLAGGNCPAIPPPSGAYTMIASANAQPARCFFCGNVRKYQANGTMTPNLYVLQQDPSTGYVNCNNERDPNHSDRSGQLLQVNATETAEVRGWIVAVAAVHGGEDEFEFDILPDIGWRPASTAYAVNTFDRLLQFVTPVNLVKFGYRKYSPARPPVTGTPRWSELNSSPGDTCIPGGNPLLQGCSNATWGGVYAPIIHVEIDGWGPNRGACDDSLPGGTFSCGSNWTNENAPLGWTYDASTQIWWPFPMSPFPFVAGDYVRVVGTLWKDFAHSGFDPNTPDYQEAAINCWDSGSTHGIGWQEIHGVDFMEHVDRDPNAPMHIVTGYALCSSSAGQQTVIRDTFSMGSQPANQPNAVPVIREGWFGPVIDWSTVDLFYNDPANPGSRMSSGSFYLSATPTSSARALFNALYDVYWDNCGAGFSACGAQCIPTTDDVDNCGACGHQCAGIANGHPVCTNSSCSTACDAGYTSCSGVCIRTDTDVSNCGSCGHHCTAPANGVATCSAGVCSYTCNAFYEDCGTSCARFCP